MERGCKCWDFVCCFNLISDRIKLSDGLYRTGLPPSLTDPYDSASDSEEEDEADEDSNGMSLPEPLLRCSDQHI